MIWLLLRLGCWICVICILCCYSVCCLGLLRWVGFVLFTVLYLVWFGGLIAVESVAWIAD